MKKLLSVVLTVVLLLSVFPLGAMTANAQTSGTTGDCTWTLDGTVLTISGNGEMGDYSNSSTLPWGTIITKVIIENGVTKIGKGAFYRCRSLTSVTIPDSVTSIGNGAFYICESLTSITIPDSVTSIGLSVFLECRSLTSIIVDENNTEYSSQDGVLFSKTKTELICYPAGRKGTSYIIPNSVTSIGRYAFYSCESLTSVTIPDSVTSIVYGAFCWSKSLISVIIPDSVTSIEEFTFYFCKSLTSVTIPDSVTSIGESAFRDCTSLKNIWYYGSSTNRNNISISDYNTALTNANWHYNTCKVEHTYSSNCDTTCNNCDWERTTTTDHVYTNSCDTSCNVCSHTRTITHSYKEIWDKDDNEHWYECSVCGVKKSVAQHTYSNACDTDCNSCGHTRTVPDHVYTNSCDTTCNVCDAVRSITHKYEWVVDQAENCGVDGSKHEECSVCYTKRNENTVIPATGKHTYDNDCDKDCNICKQIRVTGDHAYVWIVDKEENCGEKGEKHAECSICGSKQFVGTEIAATGNHVYSNNCDTSCNVCQATRTITHVYKTTTTKATTSKNGSIIKKCFVCGKVTSNTAFYYPKTFKLSDTSYAYNGKTKTPTVSVKDSKGKTISSKYYTVSYASGRKNVGKYKVTITFNGNYSGTKTLYFTINPKAASINKLTAKSKAITVKLNRSLKQSTGYEIQYSTSKKFTKAKTKKITSYKTTSVTLKKLSAKKTYYVRVRTYKTVGKTKYYSNWSSYKYTKTKK